MLDTLKHYLMQNNLFEHFAATAGRDAKTSGMSAGGWVQALRPSHLVEFPRLNCLSTNLSSKCHDASYVEQFNSFLCWQNAAICKSLSNSSRWGGKNCRCNCSKRFERPSHTALAKASLFPITHEDARCTSKAGEVLEVKSKLKIDLKIHLHCGPITTSKKINAKEIGRYKWVLVVTDMFNVVVNDFLY